MQLVVLRVLPEWPALPLCCLPDYVTLVDRLDSRTGAAGKHTDDR